MLKSVQMLNNNNNNDRIGVYKASCCSNLFV